MFHPRWKDATIALLQGWNFETRRVPSVFLVSGKFTRAYSPGGLACREEARSPRLNSGRANSELVRIRELCLVFSLAPVFKFYLSSRCSRELARSVFVFETKSRSKHAWRVENFGTLSCVFFLFVKKKNLNGRMPILFYNFFSLISTKLLRYL